MITMMRTTRFRNHTILILLLIIGFVTNQTLPCEAQNVFASRSFIPLSVDAVTMVTDWQDSVYVVTNSGRVIAYDTLFTSPRPLAEVSNFHVDQAFVYNQSLFFHSVNTGTVIYAPDGRRQFINWDLSYLGFNHRMQPFFVTPDGTFTLRGSDHGMMTVVRHDIQVPFETRSQYAFFDQCVVVVRPGTDSEVYRSDGSRAPLSLWRELFGRLVHPIDSLALVVMETGSVVHIGRDVCVSPESLEVMQFTPTEVFSMNGGSFRTSANSPLALMHGDVQLGTAKLVLRLRDGGFDTSYSSLVSQQQRTASTTDRAIYLSGRDGNVIRISLESKFVTTRPAAFCDNCQINGSAQTYARSSGNTLRITAVERSRDKRFDVLIGENDSTVRRLSIEDTSLFNPQSLPDIRLYHVFPDGMEFLQINDRVATKRHNQPWNVRRNAPSLARASAIDSTTIYFELDRRVLRYRSAGDSLIDQYLPVEVPVSALDAGREYFIFSSLDSLYLVRRNDWNTTPTCIATALPPGRVVGEADGRIVSVKRITPTDGGSSTNFDSLHLYFLDAEQRTVDSVRVTLLNKLGTVFLYLVVSDTFRVLDLSSMLNYTIDRTGTLRVDSVERRPDVTLIPGYRYRFLTKSIISVLGGFVGRESLIDFGLDPTTSGDDLDAVDKVTHTIFMVNVYPNPGTSSATLELRRHGLSDAYATELFLVDLLGNRIRDFSTSADFRFTVGTIGRVTLDYSGIPPGQYLLVIRNGGTTSSKLVSIAR